MKILDGTFQAVFRYERFLAGDRTASHRTGRRRHAHQRNYRTRATPNCAAVSNFEEKPTWATRNSGKNTRTLRARESWLDCYGQSETRSYGVQYAMQTSHTMSVIPDVFYRESRVF